MPEIVHVLHAYGLQSAKILIPVIKSLLSFTGKWIRMPGIKKSFIGSGVRYDLLFPEWNKNAGRDEGEYLEELVRNHVSGRLKVAPEHTSPQVLSPDAQSSF